jgi:hypothetical protein
MHQRSAGGATSHRDDIARPFVPSTFAQVRALGTVWWGAQQCRGTFVMVLLTAFLITVVLGDLIAIGLSAIVEQFSKPLSLFVFLFLFLGVIPIAWRVAVRATEPEGPIMRRLGSAGARKP